MNMWYRISFLACLLVTGCKSCTEQHDPSRSWELFKAEQQGANAIQPILQEDGSLPPLEAPSDDLSLNPTDKKYASLCASCHGANGAGDGPAGASMNPKPTNFVTWDYNNKLPDGWAGKTDEYIATIIAKGGSAVGKSALMAAWGGLFKEEELAAMVEKIKSFRQ
jgi:mono/diheme cytochrome c family protein